jgi:hypothetical protein
MVSALSKAPMAASLYGGVTTVKEDHVRERDHIARQEARAKVKGQFSFLNSNCLMRSKQNS